MPRKPLVLSAVVAAILLAGVVGGRSRAGDAKPKYGPSAVPLSRSSEFFREAPAPDFWALAPYYAGQPDGRTCSVASVAMVVNAARAPRDLGSEDALVTVPGLLEKTGSDAWRRNVGALGMGVTLDQLSGYVAEALRAYDIQADVDVLHVEPDAPTAAAAAVREWLVASERSARDFLIANHLQGAYTGDAMIGHVSPVGAYDAKRGRVLVLDPDREWYEPYWVPEEAFVRGLATVDAVSGKARGLLRVRLRDR